jgi:hypothetical protein
METHYKSKLSKHQSYPVGLETLSQQLEGAPQVRELSLRFYPTGDQSQAAMEGRHPILFCRFLPHDEHRWQLDIMAVTRTVKARAREELLEQGIPRLRSWLAVVRSDYWLSDCHYFVVSFNCTTGELDYEEPS